MTEAVPAVCIPHQAGARGAKDHGSPPTVSQRAHFLGPALSDLGFQGGFRRIQRLSATPAEHEQSGPRRRCPLGLSEETLNRDLKPTATRPWLGGLDLNEGDISRIRADDIRLTIAQRA